MFVRTKSVRDRNYYYLVESVRIGGTPRQKVIAYLGPKKPTKKELERIKREFES